ncbi:hypothetical protein [Serratia sp. M24T3]|uniref:hypothetical protein n=1 Tax=Serratia sp. M24T3 TaxID=932213 RepID=UPI00025BBCEE|nr:hypothetical protein [Serratia sp. M24T3]EIC82051.1 hypothetical protein SPM24T3_23852 [Serratia sp. M24T3]
MIFDNTSVIDSFVPRSFPDTVEVRRMLSRTHKESQLFIVTLKSDLNLAADTTVVKPFAEIVIRGEKLRFTVQPKNQYPDLSVSNDVLISIENSVAKFMEDTFATQVYSNDIRSKESFKECHRL